MKNNYITAGISCTLTTLILNPLLVLLSFFFIFPLNSYRKMTPNELSPKNMKLSPKNMELSPKLLHVRKK